MNEKNIMKFGYEDTDKKVIIELYEIEFEVKNINENTIESLNEIGTDEKSLKEQINKMLGENAVEEINKKRIADGYEEMDIKIEMAIISCAIQAYTKVMTDISIGNISKTMDEVNKTLNERNNIYNRNYRRNNYRGNRYRRY